MSLNQPSEDPPVPVNDGAADHLEGIRLPYISLTATNNGTVNMQTLPGVVVYYVYPMTGRPDISAPDGWREIPGAKGCTQQSCGFRDHFSEIQALNAQVYGLSTQATDYQIEAKERLHLPFELLSDVDLTLKASLKLPTFEVVGMELYRRITLIVRDGLISKVFYPVYPPDESAEEVISWLGADV